LQKHQGRIQFGGALSGRDTNAVQKTMNGLLKLMYPFAIGEGAEHGDQEIPDSAIEWAARLALECRRRVKEQQKRIGSAEFRNTHFSYQMGADGVEQFVATPELQSEDSIGDDPLPPGQVWVLSPGGLEEHPGLFRVDATGGPGSGVKILNQPSPAPFKESVRCAEQNLYTRARELVGDRDPRSHEFSVQMRAFDASKSGTATGVGALLALCSALLEKSLKGGLIVVGGLNLGGSIEPVYNAVTIVEAAADKGAKMVLLPVTTRKQLVDLDDDVATRVTVVFYSDARDALLKALAE
jgi:ATP-dependent Lon protease